MKIAQHLYHFVAPRWFRDKRGVKTGLYTATIGASRKGAAFFLHKFD